MSFFPEGDATEEKPLFSGSMWCCGQRIKEKEEKVSYDYFNQRPQGPNQFELRMVLIAWSKTKPIRVGFAPIPHAEFTLGRFGDALHWRNEKAEKVKILIGQGQCQGYLSRWLL